MINSVILAVIKVQYSAFPVVPSRAVILNLFAKWGRISLSSDTDITTLQKEFYPSYETMKTVKSTWPAKHFIEVK